MRYLGNVELYSDSLRKPKLSDNVVITLYLYIFLQIFSKYQSDTFWPVFLTTEISTIKITGVDLSTYQDYFSLKDRLQYYIQYI